MLLKCQFSADVQLDLTKEQDKKVSDLKTKLPRFSENHNVLFVANGSILDKDKQLKDLNLQNSSVIYCLVKNATTCKAKETARKSLPANLNEVVKSFKVLLDHYGSPFGEKLLQIIQSKDSFNALLTTVPGNLFCLITVK